MIFQTSYGFVKFIPFTRIEFSFPRDLSFVNSLRTVRILDEARSSFFFHTMEKVVKKIVCTLPNANFAREHVTRRGLIALARTNCNQRRDCDNICPAPYSNTYLHTYGDQRMKMLLF